MADKTVTARLKLEINQYLTGLGKAKASTSEFGREVAGVGTSSSKNMQGVAHASLLMSAGIAAGMGLAVKAAMDWETAWAGVTKTVSGTKAQMADLEGGLRGLATTLPSSHKEIAGIAEAAGQLGIQRDAIVGFTKTMVALGVSTNLTADQAATSIAQIANVMQTPQAQIDRFGATLVALGNVGASTESEILEMATRLAGAGKLVGASEADVLALANAMTSMGIEAQLGGGAFSRVLLKIFTAVKSGGDKLEGFARAAGSSAKQFAADFQKDPIRAVDGLVHGLDRIDKGGGNVIATLADLGFKGTQDLQVLLKLKGSGDLLAQSLDLGSKAWQENTALTQEAEKRYATTESQLKILKNQVVDVGIKFGDVMLPGLKGTTAAVGTMVSGFSQIPGSAQTVIVAFGGILTAGLGVIGLVGTFGPKVKAAMDALSGMGALGTVVAGNLGAIGTALAAAGIALGIYTYIVGVNGKRQAEAKQRADEYTTAILQQGTALGKTTDQMALSALVVGDVGAALRKAGQDDLSVFINAMNTGGIRGQVMRDSLRDLEVIARRGQSAIGRLLGQDDQMPKIIGELQHGDLAGTALGTTLLTLAKSGDFTEGSFARMLARLREQNEALAQGEIAAKDKATVDAALAVQSEGTASASGKLATAFTSQATAAAAATKEIKDMIDAEHAALDPLFGMLDAVKGNREAQKALADAIKAGKSSTAEITDLQIAAAKSALDFDAAATQLAGSIATGAVNVDVAKAQLQLWVDQGLISAETAKAMAVQFDTAASKADLVAGERIATLTAVDNVTPVLTAIEQRWGTLKQIIEGNPITAKLVTTAPDAPSSVLRSLEELNAGGGSKPKNSKPPGSGYGNAVGGWAGSGPMLAGPRGTDRIRTYLSDDEFVVRADVARRNAGALEHLNRTGQLVGTRFTGTSAPASSTAPVGGTTVIEHHHHEDIRLVVDGRELTKVTRKQSRVKGTQTIVGPRR